MLKFPDIYTTCIYRYIFTHNESYILYKDIKLKYSISYPTIRKRIKWLVDHRFIKKEGRYFEIIERIAT